MNIFVLDEDPCRAARAQCDKHVVKMVLESAQLACSVYEPGAAPYRRTHYQHPCAMWVRASAENWRWLVLHGLELGREYTRRYGRRHKSQDALEWCLEHPPELPAGARTPFVQCVPENLRGPCAVEAYRAYYRRDKAAIATWRAPAIPPDWFTR